MRIVYCTPFFDPAGVLGGPVPQLRAVCSLMAARGHQVEVVALDLEVPDDVPRNQRLEVDGYGVHYVETKRMNRVAPFYCPQIRPVIRHVLKQADLLHLHVALCLSNAAAADVARAVNVPYFYTTHGSLDPTRLQAKRFAKWLFLRLFERKMIRHAAGMHASSVAEIDHQRRQRARPEQIRHIPPAFLPIEHVDKYECCAWRSRLGLPEHVPIVLFMGRLEWTKGLDLLIPACASLARDGLDFHLVVAGDDYGYKQAAEKLVEDHVLGDRVHFIGFVSGRQKATVLRSADLFALTSWSEGCPTAVLEAASVGLPLLLTNPCNLPEVARYSAGALLPTKVPEISEALGEMIGFEEERREMGRNANTMVSGHFSHDRIAEQYEDWYEAVLHTRGLEAGLPSGSDQIEEGDPCIMRNQLNRTLTNSK